MATYQPIRIIRVEVWPHPLLVCLSCQPSQDHNACPDHIQIKTTNLWKISKFLTQWTFTLLYACTPTAKSGLQARRIASLKESQGSTQWQDFCEQIPIDKAGHIITIFWLLWRDWMFPRGSVQISSETRLQAS